MGHRPTDDGGPDEHERLIEALQATMHFDGVHDVPPEEAAGKDGISSDEEGQDGKDETLNRILARSFEELRKLILPTDDTPPHRRLAETAIPYLAATLCILGTIGAAVFVITSSIAVLSTILIFFLVLFIWTLREG